ncbi:MAG: portal protein [Desulfamplus sp.]
MMQQQGDISNTILTNQLKNAFDPKELKAKWESIRQKKETTRSIWQVVNSNIEPELNDYVDTNKGLNNSGAVRKSKGSNYSCSINVILNKVISELKSDLADPAVDWLGVEFYDPVILLDGSFALLQDNHAVKKWLQDGVKACYTVFNDDEVGFYTATGSILKSWFVFGNCCREIIKRTDNGKILISAVNMRDVYIDLSSYGDVGTVCRELNLTAEQAFERWGEAIGEEPTRELTQPFHSSRNTKVKKYVQIMMRNPKLHGVPYEVQSLIDRKYIVVTLDVDKTVIVNVEMHKYPPLIFSRFLDSAGEIYGKSYVWQAMPEIRTLNKLAERIMRSVDYSSLPVFLSHDSLSIASQFVSPGAIVPDSLDDQGRPKISPINFAQGDTGLSLSFFDRTQQTLYDMFLAKPPESPNEAQSFTATEIKTRALMMDKRARALILPLQAQDLLLTILRVWDLLTEKGVIPPFPYQQVQDVNGIPIMPDRLPDPLSMMKVYFSGQLAKMQKAQKVHDIDQLLQRVFMLAQANPSALDNIDFDEIVRECANVYNIGANIVLAKEKVAEERERRRQEQEKQQMLQAAIGGEE